MSKELTVLVPTRNENDNIVPLVDGIVAGLPQGGEIIFADDRDDATPERIRAVPRGAARTRIPRFAAVGLSGLIVNQGLLIGLVEGAHLHYVAAALAGFLGSTAWNFALTERWVFPGGGRTSRSSRLLRFCGMNTAAFAVQAPLLVALTNELRLPYAFSNAVALAVLVAARYLVSDQFIWRAPTLSIVPLQLESGSK